MIDLGYYESIGLSLELLAKSPYHRQYKLSHYFETEILPPLKHGQIRFYITNDGTPIAMITWAWLSEEVETNIHKTGRALILDEWICGKRLFFNDWIILYGNTYEVLEDIMYNVFPNENFATALRRNQDGSVRCISRFNRAYARRAKDILKNRN